MQIIHVICIPLSFLDNETNDWSQKSFSPQLKICNVQRETEDFPQIIDNRAHVYMPGLVHREKNLVERYFVKYFYY